MNSSIRTLQAAFLICVLFFSVGIEAQVFYVVNSQSRTLSHIDLYQDTVNNSFAALGNVPNKIVLDEETIWVVNSGDNAVQKISRSTGQNLGNILVANGSNPWDAVKHDNYLYVSGLFTGKVYKIDTVSGVVVGTVNVGIAPEGLMIVNNKLYVCNAGNYADNYTGSSVSVIDLDSFTVRLTIPVHANPQYLAAYGDKLHVSCTGNWTSIGGAVCIIDSATDQLEHTIDLGGTPGRIWIASAEKAYVADSNGVSLFAYNTVSYEILNSSQNPLPNGGSEIVGNSALIAVLVPNWSGNGSLKIFDHFLNQIRQYNVALMPTDLKMWSNSSSNQDISLSSSIVRIYPNPAREGSTICFDAGKPMQAELQVFNLRGQMITRQIFWGSVSLPLGQQFGSGMYLYKIMSENGLYSSGRFVIAR